MPAAASELTATSPTMVLVKTAEAASGLPSPRYFPARTAPPEANMTLMPRKNEYSGMTRLRAASGKAPTYRPTKKPSTTAAEDWNSIASVHGMQYRKNVRTIGPCNMRSSPCMRLLENVWIGKGTQAMP